MLSNGWAPFKEIKHQSCSERGHLPASLSSSSCRLQPLNTHGWEGSQQGVKAMSGPVMPGTEACSYTGFCFSNWIVGGMQHHHLVFPTRREKCQKIFLLMFFPILIYFKQIDFITSHEFCLFFTDVCDHPDWLLWVCSVNCATVSTQFCVMNSPHLLKRRSLNIIYSRPRL